MFPHIHMYKEKIELYWSRVSDYALEFCNFQTSILNPLNIHVPFDGLFYPKIGNTQVPSMDFFLSEHR